ncbi:MAG: cupin domain-containing protein [Bacteroidota bacterium]
MIIKNSDNQYFRAGDHTWLTEVLHPKNNLLDLPFSLAFAFLQKDETSLLHTLNETEVYYIIDGKGEFILEGERHAVEKGDCIVVRPKIEQSLVNKGDSRLEFLCIVTPPWTEEGEQILASPKNDN